MKVVIIGGGVGGLGLALCLHDKGIACEIYEAAGEIREVGVGINLLPHAMRVLGHLGLESDLAGHAVEARFDASYNRFGQLIYRELRGRFAGYQYPQFSIHRADLQKVLLEAVKARLGQNTVRLGHRCVDVEQDDGGAVAQSVLPR